ncbi:MAG: MaoC family dehydratase [Jhaorihella sp.]
MTDRVIIDDSTIYFEDLREGDQFRTPARTITEADIVAFAGLSADYNSLHVDADYALGSQYGQRIAHGLLVLAITSGLTTRLPLIMRMGPALVGLLNLECRWSKPTFIGDTLHILVTVESLTLSSSGDKGVVMLRRDAINQRGEQVMVSHWKILVKCRDGAAQ